MSQKYKLNHQKSPPDNRDHILKVSVPLKIETKVVDLSLPTDTPKDQGSVGSCTAFAGSGLMENFYNRNMDGANATDLFSEKFLYYVTRVNVAKWSANEDSGAYLRDTMKAMVQYGIALENSFPYLKPGQTECSYSDVPDASVYTEAKNYQVTKYATITNNSKQQLLTDLKTLLQSGYSFIGGVICYENFFNDNNGLIPLPRGNIIGGHALLFVGYDDSKEIFKFKNSWSLSWGDKGYGYLPYHYVLTGNLDDLWTVYAQEHQNKPFDILVPKTRGNEFSKRIVLLLKRLTETTNFSVINREIRSDPNNSLLFMSDIDELVRLAHRLLSSINNSKSISAKHKK
jgi:C1A family cysteine protease